MAKMNKYFDNTNSDHNKFGGVERFQTQIHKAKPH